MHEKRLRISREMVGWAAIVAMVVFMQWPMLKGTWYKRTGAVPPPSAIAWNTDFEAALAQSARSGRPVLVDFAADWCPPCITMKHDVWPDPAVAAAVTDGYVPLRVDVDRRPDLAARYDVAGIPSVKLLDADGRVVAAASFLDARGMARFLAGDF